MSYDGECVSVIGTNFLDPITTLLERLESLNPSGPNELQASPPENGYSIALILLTVLMVESAIGRTQYVRKEKPNNSVEFLRSTYPRCGFVNDIEELFVVRDVIAHNHIWEAAFTVSDEANMKLVSANLRQGGDKKFRGVVKITKRKTSRLGLNVFPTRINRVDAVTVVKKATEFLLFLEKQDRRYFYLSPNTVWYRGKHVRFTKLIAQIIKFLSFPSQLRRLCNRSVAKFNAR
jgi:hypothetical protein